jgi:sortase B
MKKKANVLLILIITAVIISGGFFAYNLYGHFIDRQQSQAAHEAAEQTRNIFDSWLANATPTDEAPTPQASPETVVPSPRTPSIPGHTNPDALPTIDYTQEDTPICFISLLEAFRTETGNDDIIAFINIPGTNIQHVVAQSGCNEYYLSRDMFRQRNSSGTLFLDYRNNPDFNDFNSIIYGHILRNGLKFTELHQFRNREFFNENRYIQLFTENGLIEYEIFAVFVTHISFNYIEVELNRSEFVRLIDEILRRSQYTSRIPDAPVENILILSTCTVYVDDRLVVVGRKL